MKRLTINNISRQFFSLRRGRVQALRNVSLEIEPGSFFVLLGPSGCGKSTLLNIIAGIEKPSEGEIRLGEQIVSSTAGRVHLAPRRRDVAMVFQSYALYPHMTVFDNIAFPLKIAKTDRQDIQSRVREVARILEIKDLLGVKPGELSGGQRQRVALGRAIVRRPSLLLLDEPLSNLDALLRVSMRSELKQIQRRIGVTTVYVTHDQTEALSLADRLAVLHDGRVLQVGSPSEIYHDPAAAFVARFVGTPPMNLLPGSVLDAWRHAFPADPEDVAVGFRPQQAGLVEPSGADVRGTVTLLGSPGNEQLLYVKIDGHQVIARADIPGVAEGDTVGLRLDPADLYFFDSRSGDRLR